MDLNKSLSLREIADTPVQVSAPPSSTHRIMFSLIDGEDTSAELFCNSAVFCL